METGTDQEVKSAPACKSWGSPTGSVRIAALLEAMPWQLRQLRSQEAPGQPRFAVRGDQVQGACSSQKKHLQHQRRTCFHRVVFQQSTALFRLTAAVSELGYPAGGNSWHRLAPSAGSVLFHSVPQKLRKFTQSGSAPFLPPGREGCVQPEPPQRAVTHIPVSDVADPHFQAVVCHEWPLGPDKLLGLNLGSKKMLIFMFSPAL